jgi:hypothetical protein
MKRKATLGLLTFLVIGLASLVVTAHSQEAVIIAPCALNGDDYTDPYEQEGDTPSETHAYVYTWVPTGESAADGFYAPINFPPSANGKRIYRLTVSYYDFDSGEQIAVYLRKVNIYNNQAVVVGSVGSGTAFASNIWSYMKKGGNTMSYRTIDNSRYAWYVFVYVGDNANTRVGPIKVEYN